MTAAVGAFPWGSIIQMLMGGAGGAAGAMANPALGAAASGAMGGAMANPALGGAAGGTGMLSPQMLEILKSPEFKNMLGKMGEMGEGEKRPIMYPELMPPKMGMQGMQGMFAPYSWAPKGMGFGGY